MRIKKQIHTFIFLIIQCLAELFFLIAGTAVLSRFIFGSTDPYFHAFENAWYLLKEFYIKTYKFHFSNITVFLILLSCQYIRNFIGSRLYISIIMLLFINLLYVSISFSVFYDFGYNNALEVNVLDVYDLTITVFCVLFSQISSLYFHVNSGNIINKEFIQGIYQLEEPFVCLLVIHIFFSKYSYFRTLDSQMILMGCIILLSLLVLYFCYKVYLIRRMNTYFKNIGKISQDCFVYIYHTDNDLSGEVFKYFLKPCIMGRRSDLPVINPRLNGIVLSREQYEYCKDYIKNNICIGIDCYSKFFQSSKQNIYRDDFSYSVAIREKQLFKSDEADYISALKATYLNILTLENFRLLNYSVEANIFFQKLQKDSQYIYAIKKVRKEFSNIGQITSIKQFDKYLKLVLDRAGCELDRYTVFNNILKGYEAIIHYICTYFLISLDIKLDDAWGNFKIVNEVEKGGLGAWLEMAYRVLQIKDCYKENWLSNKIGDDISKLFNKINYPSSKSIERNKAKSVESYYHFLSNRLVNLRNCTIGHGSSAYIPTDEELLCLYKIYAYLLIEIQININQLPQREATVWIIYKGENVAFLDKLTPEIKELRYIDYLSEISVPLFWEGEGK